MLMENSFYAKGSEVHMHIKILVVDDDPHIIELLLFYLRKEGYDTLPAADGKEALEVLKETPAHLAIVDIMMPNMDGYELCEEIRRSEERRVGKECSWLERRWRCGKKVK